MVALAPSSKAGSCLQDMRRDWRRWSTAERAGAMTILVALLALSLAILVTVPST
jgi:hypothetical protein